MFHTCSYVLVIWTRYWVHDTGYRILGTGYWVQVPGYWILSTWYRVHVHLDLSFSSVEHSGLGRYGNDLGRHYCDRPSTVCDTKGGSLAIGVMYTDKDDYITFNVHRVYGKYRYPYLTTNWKQMFMFFQK